MSGQGKSLCLDRFLLTTREERGFLSEIREKVIIFENPGFRKLKDNDLREEDKIT